MIPNTGAEIALIDAAAQRRAVAADPLSNVFRANDWLQMSCSTKRNYTAKDETTCKDSPYIFRSSTTTSPLCNTHLFLLLKFDFGHSLTQKKIQDTCRPTLPSESMPKHGSKCKAMNKSFGCEHFFQFGIEEKEERCIEKQGGSQGYGNR